MHRVVIRLEVIEQGELDYVGKASLKSALRRIRDNPDAGKPLTRALQGCYSIRVEGSENRLVYRVDRTGSDLVVEVLAIGRRRGNAAYDAARSRI